MSLPWLTVLAWILISFNVVLTARTWRRMKQQDKMLDSMMRQGSETLDRYLAVVMKIGEAPVRQSERDPRLWSIDVEPELLAVIQGIERSARERGATVVTVKNGE